MPNRQTAVQMHIDVFARDWHQAVIDEYRNGLQSPVERFVAELVDARTSSDYTDSGRAKKLDEIRLEALKILAPFEKRVADYDARINAAIASALPGRKERDVAALLLEREIRDRLMAEGADPVTVTPRYLDAIKRGDDVFVSAVENAPANWPLLNDQVRAEGLKLKVAKLPIAAEVEQLKRDRDITASIVQAARYDIDLAAGINGVALTAQGPALDADSQA